MPSGQPQQASQPPQRANQRPPLPGGSGSNTIELDGDVLNAVQDVQDRVSDAYLTEPGQEYADVVSLAVTILQRAIGKDVVLLDPETGRSDKSLTARALWKPPGR